MSSMKELVGTVTGMVQAPQTSYSASSYASSQTANNVDALLSSFQDKNGKFFSRAQVKELTNLSYNQSNQGIQKIFDINDKPMLYQLLAYSYEKGVDELLKFITEFDWNNREQIIKYLPTLTPVREKMYRDINAMKEKAEAVEGLFVCGKCGSRRTISIDRSTRSADEAMTVFVTCVDCNSHWRIG